MKINKIYISAFGKLKDFTLTLDGGFNIIYGDNENGKTTVMNFIKMMFYGSGKKTQNIALNPRLKYAPWSGDTMGGKIFFEHSSHRYCLEREFKKSDSTDRIILTDLDTGENLPASSNIGSEFFGLSAAAFERCMFIESSVFALKDAEAEGEINSRLSNIVVSGDGDISYQTVISRLEGAKNKIISKSGRAGSFAKDSIRLEELKARLSKAENDASRRFELNEGLAKLKAEYEKINAELAEVQQTVNSENDIRNAEKMREYLKLKQELDQLKKALTLSDGSIADSLYISKLNFCIGKIEAYENRIKELSSEAERLHTELELSSEEKIEQTKQKLSELKQKNAELEDQKAKLSSKLNEIKTAIPHSEEKIIKAQKAKRRVNPILLISGIAVLILSVLPFFVSQLLLAAGLVGMAVGAILVLLSFIIKPADKAALMKAEEKHTRLLALSAEGEKRVTDIKTQADAIIEQISVLSAAVETSAELKEQRRSDLQAKQEQIKSEEEKLNSAKKDLENLSNRYSSGISTSEMSLELEKLNEKAEQLKALRLRLNYLATDLDGISYEEARARLENASSASTNRDDFELAKSKSEALSAKKSELISEISAAVTELKTGFRSSENPENIRRELNSLIAGLKSQKNFCDAADIACAVLAESFGEIRRGYGSVLEEKTLENFSALSRGKYKNLNISKSLDITVDPSDSFGTRESDYLSQGAADQLYLSLRLAMSELIAEEPLPVMLDDALSQYDDNRTDDAISFLKQYSQNTQTVLFTCHGSVCEIAEQKNISYKTIISSMLQ